ncbi:MAG: methyltransferase [Rickettsiales bacterium]|jgi:16S rRNA G966 N2-methylase RsmD|nr:methyltransferase [Rickettsiales bacterium]
MTIGKTNLYYSSFITGFQNLIAEWLASDIKGIKIIYVFDGGILYESEIGIDEVRKIGYFNNSFLVLHKMRGKASADEIAGAVANGACNIKLKGFQFKTFRVMAFDENQPCAVNRKTMAQLIYCIERATGAKFSDRRADAEFWLLSRSEGFGLFMLKASRDYYKPQRGELRPELARILCRLGAPKKDDVVCDPFCGSGAIPLARARFADYKGIFASDIDKKLADELKARVKKIKNGKLDRSFFVKNLDFFQNKYENGFFDVIMTDPPWGEFKEIAPDFYNRFFVESARILRSNGRMILLSVRGLKTPGFDCNEKYDILVNGKKASVYLLSPRR